MKARALVGANFLSFCGTSSSHNYQTDWLFLIGFVSFERCEDAQLAVVVMNGARVENKRLLVEIERRRCEFLTNRLSATFALIL